MKRKLWIVLTLVAALFLTVFAASCKHNTPPEQRPEEGPETGVYYYDGEGGEYLITLYNGYEFTFDVRGRQATGEYKLVESALTLKFSDKTEITATYANDAVTLKYEGTEMRFLKKIEFSVSFEVNGGSAVAAVTVINGKTAAKPTDPTRENYVFIGWYKDSNLTEPFDFATPITASITLYARWIQKSAAGVEFTVAFDLNYPQAANPESKETVGGKIYNAPSPSRSGYEFSGWFVSQYDDGAKLSYKYTEDTVFSENTTLYAEWRADAAGSKLAAPVVTVSGNSISWEGILGVSSYRVAVTGPEGFGTVDTTVATTSYTLPFNTSPAGDYEIRVTALASNSANNSDTTIRYYRNKALARVSLFKVVEPDTLVFNEVANAERYLITIVCGNSEHRHTLLDIGKSTSYNFSNCEMPYGGITFTVTAAAEGYAPSTSKEFVFERNLYPVEGLDVDESTETLHWNALENAEYYVAEITSDGATYTKNVGKATSLSLKEYGAGTLVIKVTAKAKGYYSPEAIEYAYNKTSLATPSQIRIVGTALTWNEVDGATGYTVRIGNQTFSANGNSFELAEAIAWVSSEDYTLSVRADGAVNSVWSDVLDIRYYSMYATLNYEANTVSWRHVVGASYYEVKINDGITRVVGDNYAQIRLTKSGVNAISVRYFDGSNYSDWATIEVTAYQITFDSASGAEIAPRYYAYGDMVTLPKATRGGYEFSGWYNIPGGATANGARYDDEFYFYIKENLVLYANWSPKLIAAKYHDERGDLDGKAGGAVFGEDYKLDVPVASDRMYAFAGWYTQPDGNGEQLTDEKGNSLLPWYFPEDTDVYAYWANVLEFNLLQNNTWSVVGGVGAILVTSIRIPHEYTGEDGVTRKVTVVDGYAFSGCARLLTVEIPNTVRVVESATAFYNCNSLTAINVYKVDGVIDVIYDSHDGALIYNNTATGECELVFFPLAKKGAYAIPEGVTELPLRVFATTGITAITIPASLKSIRERAFQNCTGLTDITFVTGGTDELYIETNAFMNCYSLSSVTMPARLLNLDVTIFTGCTALTDVFVESGSARFTDDNGVVFNRAKDTLLYYPTGRAGDYTVPAGITTVGESAFTNASRLTSLTVPGGVLSKIGDHAFYGCTALASLTFSANALENLTIGNYAFYGCTKLTAINFEKGSKVMSIGNYAFAGNVGLGALTIPSSLRTIGNNAFDGDYTIKTVTVEDNISPLVFGSSVFNNCTGLTTVYLPANLAQLQLNVFDGCENLQNVYVSLDSEQYGDLNGVLYNRDLTEILYYPKGRNADSYALPSSVTAIGDRAFEGNKVLTGFTIPAGIIKIGNYAFANCPNLDSVTFEQGTAELTIGDNAFANCTALSAFAFPERTKSIGNYALYGSTGIERVTLPASLETIGSYAFYNVGIFEITLHEGITGIGSHAFSYTPLREIVIPASVVTIGNYAFDYCTDLVKVSFAANSKLETIGSYAFQRDTALKEFTVPKSVKEINNYAFYYCSALTDLTFENTTETNLSIGNNAFAYCSGLKKLDLPIQLLTIGNYAFSDCSQIEEVNFAERTILRTIGSSAFSHCSSITELVVPGSVQDNGGTPGIGDAAFFYCSELRAVTFLNGSNGRGTLTFGKNVFQYDSKLESIVLPSRVTGSVVKDQYGSGAGLGGTTMFGSCTALREISIDGESSSFAVVDGVLYTKDMTSLLFCPAARTEAVVIPNTVTFIQAYAFQNSHAQSVTFEDGGADLEIGYSGGNNSYSSAFYGAQIKNIVLPSRLTAFYSNTFGLSKLESITIPARVKTVANNAFANCTELKEVIFEGGSGNLAIGTSVFAGCTALKSLVIPSNVTIIGNYAFQNMTGLTEIIFEEGINLRSIGENAFYGCTALTALTIPDSVTALPKNIFQNCSSLKTLNLPKGLQTLEISAFAGCTSLSDVNFPDDAENFKTIDGVIFNKAGTTLYYYPEAKADEKYTIPSTVTTVGAYAFRYNTHIASVTIPKSVTSIGMAAFAECTALSELVFEDGTSNLRIETSYSDSLIKNTQITELNFPARLTYIGDYAFDKVTLLTSVNFAKGSRLTTIGGSAFSNTSLTQISLPASLVTVGTNLFYECKSLQTVVFEGKSVSNIGVNMFYKCSSLVSVVLPANVLTIGNSAFKGCTELEEITVPETVQTIGYTAFQDCTSLKSVKFLGEMVKTIGYQAFQNCASLTAITLPDSVETIGYQAFQNCIMLESAHLSEKMIEIADSLFQGDVNLAEVNFPSSLESVGNYAFQSTALTLVSLFDRVKTIGQYAFDGVATLKEVRMQYGVTGIGDYAFRGCVSLEEIEIPASVATLGINPFGGVPGLKLASDNTSYVMVDGVLYNSDMTVLLVYPATKAGHFTIPESVTTLGAGAFAGSAITGITLPSNLKTIPESLFANCVNLTSIVLPERLTVIGDNAFRNSGLTEITFGGYLTTIGNYAFADCTSLKEVNFRLGPNERLPLTIGNYAFSGCTSLESIAIPRRVRTQVVYVDSMHDVVTPGIGNYAFQGCTSLESLTFGADTAAENVGSFLTVGKYAFSGCTSLSEVILPDYLDNYFDMYGQSGGDHRGMDEGAFSGCTSLKKVTFGNCANAYVYGNYVFQNCTSLKQIVFAEGTAIITTGMFRNTGLEELVIPSQAVIGTNAFADCALLKSITIECYGVGQSAFANCTSLESVTFGEQLRSIGANALVGCTSITSIVIPSTVTSLGSGAFDGWTGAQKIYMRAEQAHSGWYADWNSGCNAEIIWGYKG